MSERVLRKSDVVCQWKVCTDTVLPASSVRV